MVDPEDAFDRIVAMFDGAVYIVTTTVADQMSGCLVGFGTQVSIDPPRFLVGISEKNHTFEVLSRAERLAVHLVATDQHDLAELFGEHTGDVEEKFSRCDWRPGPQGVPILVAAAAWFSGRIVSRVPCGDHVGFLVAPDAAEVRDGGASPLRLGDVTDLDAGHDA